MQGDKNRIVVEMGVVGVPVLELDSGVCLTDNSRAIILLTTPMKIFAAFCLPALTALVISGCASLGVSGSSTAKPGVDFTQYSTYSWFPGVGRSNDPRIRSAANLDAQIRRAVESKLAAAGLQKAAAESADLGVSYQVVVQDKITHATIDESFGYNAGWYERGGGSNVSWTAMNPERRATVYELGSLIVDLVDIARDEVVWRGSAEAKIFEDDTSAGDGSRVDAAVNRMFAGFPPK